MGFDYLCDVFSEKFVILRRIQRDIIINMHRSSCIVPVTLFRFSCIVPVTLFRFSCIVPVTLFRF